MTITTSKTRKQYNSENEFCGMKWQKIYRGKKDRITGGRSASEEAKSHYFLPQTKSVTREGLTLEASSKFWIFLERQGSPLLRKKKKEKL